MLPDCAPGWARPPMACEASSVDRLSVGAFESIVATQDPRHVRQAAYYLSHSATTFLSSRGSAEHTCFLARTHMSFRQDTHMSSSQDTHVL